MKIASLALLLTLAGYVPVPGPVYENNQFGLVIDVPVGATACVSEGWGSGHEVVILLSPRDACRDLDSASILGDGRRKIRVGMDFNAAETYRNAHDVARVCPKQIGVLGATAIPGYPTVTCRWDEGDQITLSVSALVGKGTFLGNYVILGIDLETTKAQYEKDLRLFKTALRTVRFRTL